MMAVIGLSVVFRFIAWNGFITEINPISTDFWKLWYMKIYYPTHTRLDVLGTGVLIGYLMQYSSVFKKRVEAHGNLLFFLGILLLGISFWICREQTSRTASIFGFFWPRFQNPPFYIVQNLILLLSWHLYHTLFIFRIKALFIWCRQLLMILILKAQVM